MAPTSLIKLGPYTDIRPVLPVDVRQITREGANPFAAPGGGTQGYNDLEGWAEFTMRDWQAGAGQQDPEAGGFLYGNMEGRVPGQLIHPQHVWPQSAWAGAVPNDYLFYQKMFPKGPRQYGSAGMFRFGPTNTGDGYLGKAIAVRYAGAGAPAGLTAGVNNGSTVFFLCMAKQETTVRVSICTSLSPDVEVAFQEIVVSPTGPFPRWQKATMAGTGTIVGTDYAKIRPTDGEITLIEAGNTVGSYTSRNLWTNDVWQPEYGLGICVITHHNMIQNSAYSTAYQRAGAAFCQRGQQIYAILGDTILNWASYTWDPLFPGGGIAIKESLAVFNNNIYYGKASGNAAYLNIYDTPVALAYQAQLFYSDANYLWKANGTTISYSADATTWTDVLNATTAAFPVLAMASMGGSLYYATREGVFYIAPGDYCRKLFFSSDTSSALPVRMVEFQGNIFVIMGNKLYRVDPGGGILPINLPSEDPDLDDECTFLRSIASGQDWLYVGTSNSVEDRGVIWSWQPEGWHAVGFVPTTPYELLVDRFNECVWVADKGRTWRFRAIDGVRNPFFDPGAEFESIGWFTTDRFYGTSRVLEKDIESVLIDGEDLFQEYPSIIYASVFYKTDQTNDEWVFVDHIRNISGGTVRLSNYATMPRKCKWIQLGIRTFFMYGADGSVPAAAGSVRIRAISLKYTPMVNDRFRWRLDLKVPPRLSDNDDELYTGTYSQASMINHMEACISSVVPIIYYDIDGKHYEVKVVANSRATERVEPIRGGTASVSYVYSLTLEQVMTGVTSY